MSKVGRKTSRSFRIVVSEKRRHQSGKMVEIIGFFDPRNPKKRFINTERLKHWRKVGASVSSSVDKVLAEKVGNMQTVKMGEI